MIETKKIFAFWESNEQMPAYLELCKKTWQKNIPDVEIHIINYTNIENYIGGIYDIDQLKKIPLAMQSDIISAAVLEKFGGLFLDLDCIVIDDIFNIFESISETKLIGFGRQPNALHLAVLYSKKAGNPILKVWRETAQSRLSNLPESYNWDYFGNSIINPLFLSEKYKQSFEIIDRTASGNILESAVMIGANLSNQRECYKNLYFNSYFSINLDILNLVTHGVISLHNSWTPESFKKIKKEDEFLDLNIPLAQLLNSILSNGVGGKFYNNIHVLKNFFTKKLSEQRINPKFRFFKSILVIDFVVNNINFAFDVYIENNDLINLDVIFRDGISIEEKSKYKILGDLILMGNKVHLKKSSDKNLILGEIVNLYNEITNYHITA